MHVLGLARVRARARPPPKIEKIIKYLYKAYENHAPNGFEAKFAKTHTRKQCFFTTEGCKRPFELSFGANKSSWRDLSIPPGFEAKFALKNTKNWFGDLKN